jgi:HAD superfamily hydrolase (TIGR01509 family)
LGLAELGCRFSEDEVKRAYFLADVRAAEELLPRAPFSPEAFREAFGRAFFEELGLLDRAEKVGPALMEKLISFRPARVLMPGARELLDRLHEMGYALGIISNNDGFTREKCAAAGIEDSFLFILDSTVEGVMKPDPRIFAKALGLARVQPQDVVHVGDLWGCDIMGARAMGMKAVWLGNDLIAPKPLPGAQRIDRLLDLLGLIQP